VETVNGRIQRLRETLGMTREEFAEKVHLTDKELAKVESGESVLNERSMAFISKPNLFKDGFSVNYMWLRHGDVYPEGVLQEMFLSVSGT